MNCTPTFDRMTRPAILLVLAFVASCPASAQLVNPEDSELLCPDGTPRKVWKYPYEDGLPDNTVPVTCNGTETCYVMPLSACLFTAEVSRNVIVERPAARDADRPDPISILPPATPKTPPAPLRNPPSNPYPTDEAPLPDNDCRPGTVWDFETLLSTPATHASFDKWEGQGAAGSPFVGIRNVDQWFIAAPVYGNAAPIDRIRPPGWRPEIQSQIGGDYWLHSQSTNYHGAFWVSSLYRRYSWGQHPGSNWSERATGTLTSPPCRLRARFLTFRLSGGRSSTQRVELRVRGADPGEYHGVFFSGGPGDFSLAAPIGHATQVLQSPGAPQQFPPESGPWTLVRSVSPDDVNETDWMQRYVFDLAPFQGKRILIRVVDDRRQNCAQHAPGGSTCLAFRPEYINVDEFRFVDTAPRDVEWFTFDRGQCAKDPATSAGCSPVGIVRSAPPLWGFTDAHAHPMANLAFGGHVLWGDATDSLENVYDCSRPLPEIPGPGGREAIPAATVESSCYIAGDVVALAIATSLTACAPLGIVPIIGGTAMLICKSVLSAAQAALFTNPVLRGVSHHGGLKFASGAVELGGMFADAWFQMREFFGEDLEGEHSREFTLGLIPTIDNWPGAEPLISWWQDRGSWHSPKGLGKSHNRYQVLMIRRAFAGGMRLGIWDVVNSRALAFAADGKTIASDWQALKDQTDAARRIVATSLADIAAIALTPEEASAIIRSGRMAVILGSEVDELGRLRPDNLPWPRSPATPGDTMQKQVDDLWALGIRKITPVHAVNNPVGGAGLFTNDYVSNNYFLNGTPLDGEPSFTDLVSVRFAIDRSPVGIGKIVSLVLGEAPIAKEIGTDGVQPWNPQGWFEFDTGLTIPDTLFGLDAAVTWRVGDAKPDVQDLKGSDALWLPPQQVLGKQVLRLRALSDLSTFIRPVGRCDIHNTAMPDPVTDFGSVVNAQFVAADGHRNARGLYRSAGDDGETFLRAAMKRGMLIDVDHFSQNMRRDVYRLARTVAGEAGWLAVDACADDGRPCGDYPFMGVHTTVRELEKEGGGLPHLRQHFGSNNETTRTRGEIRHIRDRRGTLGVFPRPNFIPPNTRGMQCRRHSDCASWDGDSNAACVASVCTSQMNIALADRNFALPQEVVNDCDGSSKTFAVKYLFMANEMGGRGLTFTSDFNGLNGTQLPRFGMSIGGKAACGTGSSRAQSLRDEHPPNQVKWEHLMAIRQRHEHSGIWYMDYAARTPLVSSYAAAWPDPARPPGNKRWKEVVARQGSEWREDFAPHFESFKDGTPIVDKVYYNDFGPDLPLDWTDQDANGPGAQLQPLVRWENRFSGWDFNLDGLQHIGLVPDLLQDMRNVGVQWEQMGPLMHGAHDLLHTWGTSVAIGQGMP